MKNLLTGRRLSRAKRRKFYFVAILLFLFTSLLVAEGIVRHFYNKNIRWGAELAAQKFRKEDRLRILCIGDSHTFGIGAAKGESYPERLKKLIYENCEPKLVEIINLGLPGRDLVSIRQRTFEFLDAQRLLPDIVIIQGGVNSSLSWNILDRYIDTMKDPRRFLLKLPMKLMVARLIYYDIDAVHLFFSSPSLIQFIQETNRKELEAILDKFEKLKIRCLFIPYLTFQARSDKIKQQVANARKVPILCFRQPETTEFFIQKGWGQHREHPNGKGYNFLANNILLKLTTSFPNTIKCSKDLPVQKELLCENELP